MPTWPLLKRHDPPDLRTVPTGMAETQRWQAIPTQLELAEFEQFVLPHLSIGSRGPAPKLSLYKIFNYVLKILYLGCQWKASDRDRHGSLRQFHYWVRELSALGHNVRLIPPQYVKPFVKPAKNDRNVTKVVRRSCEPISAARRWSHCSRSFQRSAG